MLNVSSAVKAKFQSDYCRKELKITIGATVLTNEAIYKDGFKLTESVMDGTVEFVKKAPGKSYVKVVPMAE